MSDRIYKDKDGNFRREPDDWRDVLGMVWLPLLLIIISGVVHFIKWVIKWAGSDCL